ncbi:patatin-like phospholipase family protein [Agarivorans sp. MS3-6]|uniref:patatin-like phospholipase family protein n=1 Tax=Agarivorans sp. TSD2052 TaxID=2937286 RepID=UPI00200CA512|nr:patatin family protein [Agarivorans sp. TSD2052]UPW20663.1 patatin family protein [Agarivorans sp. TSD2052]
MLNAAPSISPCSGSCYRSPIEGDMALIAEGGGQRGIFTAGVLDRWLAAGFNPFSLLIGTSAGAQNLSSYMTCQPGFAHKSIALSSSSKRFFRLSRSIAGRSVVDLDWYFEQVNQQAEPLKVNCASEQLLQRRLLFAATKVDDKSAQYFSPNSENWIDFLKASSALPFLYKGGVDINGHNYVDGGLVAPLPVEEAYRQGARKIVVIRTKPESYQVESPWMHWLKAWVCSSGQCPKAIDYMLEHEQAYKRALDFIARPPHDAQITQIYPSQELASKLLGSKQADLDKDYQLGVAAGERFLTLAS